MWELRRLRLLHELAARGTVTAVADALHLTPSAVSQQLSQLEREVGSPLLRRVGRRLALTAEGEILVQHTRRILDQLELAQAEIANAQQSATGTVRLAVFQSAALALVPDALTYLEEHHPLVRVTMTQREPETALRETWARDFDLVVAEQYPQHSAPWAEGLDRRALVQDALWLAVPDHGRWAAIEDLPQAAQAPWVMEPVGAASRHWGEQLCRSAGFEPDVRFETADLQAHVALVRSGHAVTVMSELMLRTLSTGTPGVRQVPLSGHPIRTVFTAARSNSASAPAIRALRTALDTAAQHASS